MNIDTEILDYIINNVIHYTQDNQQFTADWKSSTPNLREAIAKLLPIHKAKKHYKFTFTLLSTDDTIDTGISAVLCDRICTSMRFNNFNKDEYSIHDDHTNTEYVFNLLIFHTDNEIWDEIDILPTVEEQYQYIKEAILMTFDINNLDYYDCNISYIIEENLLKLP